ncbi:GIY-YIG nuclease family protein [Gelidibacter salicanalis]|uniref:GIY-YIG nuclease family protein n=1 Tax=Gelidibacter salicanalis TaxID=291193 RepID=A0A5C7ADI0_9FLAO|nr:GIY-YIG nuclease family protein [Gelidibacter salicanalis]TXE06736.1 GIY-YIG nuclease family protein [Gelidibacter salicanalis]
MCQYYVYILKCADDSYYTRITNDVARRFEEHQLGKHKDCYTFKKRPVKMEFYQEFNDVLQAIFYEKKLKGWSRAKKKALIEGDFDRLQILAECRNATHYKYGPDNGK